MCVGILFTQQLSLFAFLLVSFVWLRFLGPTISHSALYAELQRRKTTVDDSKSREKAEKAAEAAKLSGECGGGAVPAQAGLLERGDVSMTRGEGPAMVLDYASEALPAAVPSITAFAKGGALVGAQVGDQQGGAGEAADKAPKPAVMDASAFGGDAAAEGGESYEGEEGAEWGEAPAPAATTVAAPASASASSSASAALESGTAPPFAASSALVQSFTRFSTSSFGSALDLYQSLQRTLLSLGCAIEAANKSKYKLKLVKCVTSQGVILFSVAVHSDPNDASGRTLIVDFKRRSDDSAQFRTLFAEIRYKMRDIIDAHASPALATPAQPVPQQQAAKQAEQ